MYKKKIYLGERYHQRKRQESHFQKGDLKYIILDLLKDKQRYGYEVIRELEENSYGLYKPSPGVVYPTLQMLEEIGYASSLEQDGKRVYSITEEGRRFSDERKEQMDEIKSHIRRRWHFKDIGLFGLTMDEFDKLGSMIAQRLRSADSPKAQRVREAISRAHQEIETILEEQDDEKSSNG